MPHHASAPSRVSAATVVSSRLSRRSLRLAAATCLSAGSLVAQPVAPPVQHPAVKEALGMIERDNAWTLDQQAAVCQIPAPPFKEAERGVYYADQLRRLGVANVRTDAEGNVIGELRGRGPGPTLVLSSHLDTVFPEGTDVTVTREGTMMRGPGIGDDCRGLATTLAVTRALASSKVPFGGRLLIVATVGEEGPGNLRGVRALFSGPLKDSIDAFISVDGTGIAITNGAVGSARYRFTVKGPGGHSYGAFGMANPIHAVGRAIAAIGDVEVPRQPRTTFNVGIITGGRSVNTISDEASFDLDMRSESWATLQELDAKVQTIVRNAVAAEQARWPNSRAKLELVIDTIGIRPAGTTPDSARLVRVASGAADALGLYAPLNASSTDANLPISLGVPAITVDGGGVGRGAHALEESYDDRTDGFKGPQWILLLVTTFLGLPVM
ncbi:MAG TPA: M20/M25/M40 family metallo-hydrolase [Gemmatimonadaceae bacterium]|nr:M20/M25/M40 family metallo-hydrolase [Gemmatimonadaceae bacterium]